MRCSLMELTNKEGRNMKKTTLMCLMVVYSIIDTFWNGYPSLGKAVCELAVLVWLFVGTLKEVSNG